MSVRLFDTWTEGNVGDNGASVQQTVRRTVVGGYICLGFTESLHLGLLLQPENKTFGPNWLYKGIIKLSLHLSPPLLVAFSRLPSVTLEGRASAGILFDSVLSNRAL